uniref:Uncharacterized protein n=1 Tax=Lygus hesperus TaxID=30085 RepID=A0A0A9WI43_LYGHE
MMSMKQGDCWTETWVMKETGSDLTDTKTIKPSPEFTDITRAAGGTITEFVDTKVPSKAGPIGPVNATTAEKPSGDGSGMTEQEFTNEEASGDTTENDTEGHSGDEATEESQESIEESGEIEEATKGNEETSISVNKTSIMVDEHTQPTQTRIISVNMTTVGTPVPQKAENITTLPNVTTTEMKNVTAERGASNVTALAGNDTLVVKTDEVKTNVVKTNATANATSPDGDIAAVNSSSAGGGPKAAVPDSNSTGIGAQAPKISAPAMKSRRRKDIQLHEKLEQKGNPKFTVRKRQAPANTAPLVAGSNVTAVSANTSMAAVPPVGVNGTGVGKTNASSAESPPVASNGTNEMSNATTISQLLTTHFNTTVKAPVTRTQPPIKVVANASVENQQTVPTNSVKPGTVPVVNQTSATALPITKGQNATDKGNSDLRRKGTITTEELEEYTSVEEQESSDEKDETTDPESGSASDGSSEGSSEDYPTEKEFSEEETASILTGDKDGTVAFTEQPPEKVTRLSGTLPSESTPGSEPPAILDKNQPQRVGHLPVTFLDWKECESLVCPDPSITCDSDQMDTKWCLNSGKPGIRLCTVDTGAPVYCKSSMVAIMSNVNLDCPKTMTKGVALGLDGAFEYIKSTMGMPDFQKKVPPVSPVKERKSIALRIYVPFTMPILTGLILALLHL